MGAGASGTVVGAPLWAIERGRVKRAELTAGVTANLDGASVVTTLRW